MLIAIEKKSGAELLGDKPDLELIAQFQASFQTEEFSSEYGEAEVELSAETKAYLNRGLVRNAIAEKAGDSASLLGTTSDATQLLLYGFCQLVAALNKADSLADVRKAAKPYAELAAGFLGKVESGEVKLPFMGKGLEKVVSDIEQRATSVAEVLAQANSTNAKQEDQS